MLVAAAVTHGSARRRVLGRGLPAVDDGARCATYRTSSAMPTRAPPAAMTVTGARWTAPPRTARCAVRQVAPRLGVAKGGTRTRRLVVPTAFWGHVMPVRFDVGSPLPNCVE
jgi:hypothetical protein